MTEKPKDRGAVMQFEVNRKRWLETERADIASKYGDETMFSRLIYISRTAIADTLRSGGTFVLVASEETITMVQRPDAEEI